MDFVTCLPILTNWKRDIYDSILVIIDWLTKMIYYKHIKVTINALGLIEIIINVIVRYHDFSDSIVTNQGSFFISKFWSLLCYFLDIKRKLSIAFHLQTDGHIKRQNSIIEAYFWAFVNFEQNNLVWLLPIAKFAYNNVKNTSIGYTPFKLNCRYCFYVFYKKEKIFNPRSKLKTAEKLFFEFQELMIIC